MSWISEVNAYGQASKSVSPLASAMVDAQDLDITFVDSIGNDVRRSRDHQFTRPGNSAWAADVWMFRQQHFNAVDDPQDHAIGGNWLVLGDEGFRSNKVFEGLRRPLDGHARERLGFARVSFPDFAHRLT